MTGFQELGSDAAPRVASRRLAFLLIAGGFGVFLVVMRGRIHFDWALFWVQLRLASPGHLAMAMVLIFSTNWVRSARWALFLRPLRRVPPFSLVGAQFIGFSAVALFGRIADLTRPYVISRRVGLPLASQIALYTIERIFDLAAVALLFSAMLLVTPRSTPHHEVFVRTGLLAFAGTSLLCGFVYTVWQSGERVARLAQTLVGRVSQPLGVGLAHKLLSFRDGLSTLRSVREVLFAGGLSMLMWGCIAEAYVQTAHAFTHTAALRALSFVTATPLMAASMGGSLVQLPILGWFTQIAITSAAMHRLYGAPFEDATACGAVLLIVNTLSLIPVGLVYSRIEGMSLQEAARPAARQRVSDLS